LIWGKKNVTVEHLWQKARLFVADF